jgi:hypothetical protein
MSLERGAGISYPNFFYFLLPWPRRPITMANEIVDLYDCWRRYLLLW